MTAFISKTFLFSLLLFNSFQAFGYSCHSDCHREARFRYPCPTFSNPGRKCTGKNHVKFAACELAKATSCNNILQRKADQLALSYSDANNNADFNDCVAVVAAGLAAYGAKVGGPVGAAVGAGGGVPLARIACRKAFN